MYDHAFPMEITFFLPGEKYPIEKTNVTIHMKCHKKSMGIPGSNKMEVR